MKWMHKTMPELISVNISEKTGQKKVNIDRCMVLVEHGLADDAHAGDWHRQVSLLAVESIDKMRGMGLDVGPGDFAENLTTRGIDLVSIPVGTRLEVGAETVLEITQIGKECHQRCAIYYQAGDCVMPKEGVFARVLEGGRVEVGDEVRIIDHET
jgi:MOSC domain-containing protein YiiM